MWVKAAGPLAAILEGASKCSLTLYGADGDVSPGMFHYTSLPSVVNSPAALNPQPKRLMNERVFKNSHSYLLRENFGQKAKVK